MRCVSFMSVRLSFLFDKAFEIAKLVLPHVAVVRDPVVDILEGTGIELVEAIASDLDLGDELRLSQDAQVPRDRGAADREIARDAADRLASLPQKREDRPSGGIGQGLEYVALDRIFGNYSVTHWAEVDRRSKTIGVTNR